WRRDAVNKQVYSLTNRQLGSSEPPEGQAAEVSFRAGCSGCKVPLWVRSEESESLVQLEACGCVLHSVCLADEAKRQHGVPLPSIHDDPSHLLTLLRRMLGIDTIVVHSITCPACSRASTSWRKLHEARGVLPADAPAVAVLAALSRGEALCLADLEATLAATAGGVTTDQETQEHLQRWREAAAKGEQSLRILLQRGGPKVGQQLSLLLSRCRFEDCDLRALRTATVQLCDPSEAAPDSEDAVAKLRAQAKTFADSL
ncbi:unnamed protein product, partial [Polarella glacialis]